LAYLFLKDIPECVGWLTERDLISPHSVLMVSEKPIGDLNLTIPPSSMPFLAVVTRGDHKLILRNFNSLRETGA
jgi:hypothetical protein